MSYEKTVWSNGDVITAQKLNNAENGIENNNIWLDNLQDQIDDLSNSIAEEYSTSGTYAVGDYVIYDGKLYCCTTAIATAEAWTAGHWTQVALADDVTDLKTDFDEITEEVTTADFDTDDNLVEGLTLSSGYYPNGYNTVYSNDNFSYLGIDVTDITKLKINGTHHIYTVTEFASMGVFLDSENTWLANIRDQAVDLSSFPIVVNVPSGATKLYLNTDYKASDYPSTLPSDLYVYPWRTNVEAIKVPYSALEKMPIALEDLSDGNKKLKIIAGVIRNSGDGWEYIDDSGHEPLNLTDISLNQYGRIVVDYGFTATKVLTLIVCPDETFASLYTAGASVGLDNSVITVCTLPKTIGGQVQLTNNAIDTLYSLFTSGSFNTSTGEIRLYHTDLSAIPAKEKFNVSVECNNATYRAIVGSQGNDYVSIYLVNASGQILKDTTDLAINIIATRQVNSVSVDANNIVDAGGNFWIYGVMEIA